MRFQTLNKYRNKNHYYSRNLKMKITKINNIKNINIKEYLLFSIL